MSYVNAPESLEEIVVALQSARSICNFLTTGKTIDLVSPLFEDRDEEAHYIMSLMEISNRLGSLYGKVSSRLEQQEGSGL